MYQYQYDSAADLLRIANENHISFADIAAAHEAEREETLASDVFERMRVSLGVMKENIAAGIVSQAPSLGGLIGQNAAPMHTYAQTGKALSGELQSKAIAYALAITEENARMKRVVACPTAGACGVVPGCLISLAELRGCDDNTIISGLLNASAIGILITAGATISGAEGGCQAEVGAASAMAASAMVQMEGGGPEQSVHAAAMALKNVLGLVCDPVAGLVEVPCSKRNAMGVANAAAAADMALAGIQSVIPLDEVITAMKHVGQALPFELKETARGGCAATKTGKAIRRKVRARNERIIEDVE